LGSLRAIEDKEERDFQREQAITAAMMDKLSLSWQKLEFTHQSTSSATLHANTIAAGDTDFVLRSGRVAFAQAEALRSHYEKHSGSGGVKPISDVAASELLVEFASRYLEMYPSPVAELEVPQDGRVVVVGDTHGQLQDMLLIMRAQGPPSPTNVYLINGDIADRGENACEIFFLLAAYFLANPGSVLINRGNHEAETLNHLAPEDGGGFYREVCVKFGASMYVHFLGLMKALSMCVVIGKKIFVVHAGLSNQQPLTLEKINKLDHTSLTVPDTLDSPESKLWLDLVWSDPQEEVGIARSPRGAGVLWGPDITKRFFQDNPPINLIVRSHEVPDTDTGYSRMHYNRVITLFSASNYAGENGNKGAVMIFEGRSFPDYTFYEYYSPPLENIARLVGQGKPVQEWVELGEKMYDDHQQALRDYSWTLESQKLMCLIVESKPELFAKLYQLKGERSMVTYSEWLTILSSVLGPVFKYERAWEFFGCGDYDTELNFRDFLSRFTVVLQNEGYMSFKMKAVATAFKTLLQREATLEETFKLFDKDGDGFVTVEEMKKALIKLHVNMSDLQMESVLHAIFRPPSARGCRTRASWAPGVRGSRTSPKSMPMRSTSSAFVFTRLPSHDTERIPVHHVFGKLASMYKHMQDLAGESASTSESRMIAEVMRSIGFIFANPGGEGTDRLVDLFKELDADNNGFIETQELIEGLWEVEGVQDVQLSSGEPLTKDHLRKVAEAMDLNLNGTISLVEFIQGLHVDEDAEEAADSLAGDILSILLRHRSSIRTVAHMFDTAGVWKISKADFLKLLRALNEVIKDSENGWSDSQVVDLCEALALDGFVQYRDVFDSFLVMDSENPDIGVSLASERGGLECQ